MLFGEKKEKPISPVTFFEKGHKENPVVFMDKEVNTETNFAILRTTANGKYVRGKMLFYSMNGVEVYTELNNVIFVDTVNKTMFVRQYDKVVNEIAPSDPEQRQYIILYTDLGYENSDEGFPLRWESVTGRTTAYDSIKVNAPVIDVDKSLVLVENVPMKDSLTVRQFMNYIKNSDIIQDENFEINDFAGSEYV
jgi:hypothetical protein